MPAAPVVSVIIPHLDDLERLRACMAALEAQTLARGALEIIVADNGSSCGLDRVEQACPAARVIAVAQRGAGPARNAAVALARGSVLAFTDADCLPEPGWLAAGLAALRTADLVGGAMRVGVTDPARPAAAEAFEIAFAFDNRRYVEQLGFSVTANLLVRRDVLDAVGGFKVGVPEDLEWCHRARGLGYRLAYAPDAVVMHPARSSFAALRRKWQRLTEEAHGQWQACGGSRLGWLARAAAVMASPVAHAPRVLLCRDIPSLHTRLGALAVLGAIRALRCCWMLRLAASSRRPPQPTRSASSSPMQSTAPHHGTHTGAT